MEIGRNYHQADDTRTRRFEVYGTSLNIHENKWNENEESGHWAAEIDLSVPKGVSSEHDVLWHLRVKMLSENVVLLARYTE